jgi:DNA transposition AAA+ family ATPase
MTDFFDKIAEQDARVLRATRMLPDGLLTPEQRLRHHKEVERFLEENGLTQADFARGIKEAESTVSQFFKNDPRVKAERRDDILRRGLAWVEMEARAIRSREMRPASFQMTGPAKRLFGMARRLIERADMGLAYAPAGVGKSTIVKAICAELPSAVLVTVNAGSRCRVGFLRAVHAALRRRRGANWRVTYDDVAEALRQSGRVSSRPLLIVDQAHLLHDAVFQLLMDLHDECGLSVLLVGTIVAHNRVVDDEDPQGGQLSSRIGMRLNLTPEFYGSSTGTRKPCFTVADVRRIFQQGKIRLSNDAAEMLARVANESIGHLRRVDRLVQWAMAAAAKREGKAVGEDVTVSAEDVSRAARLVEGEDGASQLPVAAPAAVAQAG